MTTWVGIAKQDEEIDPSCNSCLSQGVQDELKAVLPTSAPPSVQQGIGPWMGMPQAMGNAISKFLAQHPLLALMHEQGVDDAKEILCAWHATEGADYTGAPADFNKESWNTYLNSLATHIRSLNMKTEHYHMYFYVDSEYECYYVIGPRDTMIALFGWHAKNSDAAVDIDLKYKVGLTRESFLRVHAAVDYAERCHDRHFRM